MKTCSLLLLCARTGGPRAGVMLQTLPRHPQSSRNSLPLLPAVPSAHKCWDQPGPGPAGVSEIHPGCQGWAFRGKGAVFSSGWQRALCLLACSTGTSGAGQAQLARQRHRVTVSCSPGLSQDRHP